MAGVFDKVTDVFRKKSKLSTKVIGVQYGQDGTNMGEYQIFENRVIPRNVDIKSIKAADLKKYPLVNDPFSSSVVSMPYGRTPDVNKQTLMLYVKNTPEIVAIFNAIIEDIISDGYQIEPYPDTKGSGKVLVNKAEKFLQRNRFKELISEVLWDTLGTGDGYIYKASVSPLEVRELVESVLRKLPIQFKSQNIDYVIQSLKQTDEDIFSTRALAVIPSSTVTIKYNKRGVISYVQRVNQDYVEFSPEETIHIRLWRVDGKIYGFTPLQSIAREIDILTNVKDYARYFFEKGGVPNYIFIFPDETPESPSVKDFTKALQMYASLPNKFKNIIVTGNVNPIELNKMTKDMEFQQLAIYLTQVIVMVWQIPSSRLSDMLVSKGLRGSTVSTEGYYRKISHLQDVLEDVINEEILAQFKVKLKFNKSYLQDEVREVQVDLFKADAVTKKQAILADYNKKLTERKVLKLLNINDDDIEEGKAESATFMGQQTNRQSFEKNKQLLSQDQEKLAEDNDKQKINLSKK